MEQVAMGNSENTSGINSDIQAKIGKKLKEAYSDVLNEPVPDRFLELLNQMETADKKKSGSGR